MPISPSHARRIAAATTAALALALPAAASATPGNPQVLTVDDAGTATVLAGGSPWTNLMGIAVSPTNTVYVANQGSPGPSPAGTGIYANSAATPSAFAPLATGAPTSTPDGIVANGSALYSLDNDKVISMTTTAPAVQTVLSSGQLYDSLGVSAQFGAVSGTTLYTTADSSCESAEGGGAYVIAVDLTSGTQTQVADLGCAALGGIAVEAAGTLLVAETSSNSSAGNGRPGVPQIVRVVPATGKATPLSSGKTKSLLQTPQGIFYAGPSNLYVADSTAGIVQVNPTTGHQFAFSRPGGKSPLGNAYGIAQGANGTIYVSEAGVAPTLTASAAKTQKASSAGIKLTAACNRTCTIISSLNVVIKGGLGYGQGSGFPNVKGKKSLAIKLPSSVNKRIATALSKGRAVTATITLTPQDPTSGAPGKPTKLTVRLVK